MEIKLVKTIPIDKIRPDPEQPRKTFDKEELQLLANSMKSSFQIEPILLDEDYQIIIGERRWKALKLLGIKELKEGDHFRIIKDLSEKEKRKIQSDEDIQHKPIDLDERDKFWYKIFKNYGFKTDQELADFLSVGKTTVEDAFDRLEFKKKTGPVFSDMAPSVISETKGLPDRERIALVKTAKRKDIGSRKIREYVEAVRKYSDKPAIKEKILQGKIEPEQISKLEAKGEEPLQLPFRLIHSKMILKGLKTQTSRFLLNGIREGDLVQANIYEPNFAQLKVVKIEKKRLGDFTENDAKREGGYTLEQFKGVWKELHDEWDPETIVSVIHFRMIKKSEKNGL